MFKVKFTRLVKFSRDGKVTSVYEAGDVINAWKITTADLEKTKAGSITILENDRIIIYCDVNSPGSCMETSTSDVEIHMRSFQQAAQAPVANALAQP